jgi:hypothetical protein
MDICCVSEGKHTETETSQTEHMKIPEFNRRLQCKGLSEFPLTSGN